MSSKVLSAVWKETWNDNESEVSGMRIIICDRCNAEMESAKDIVFIEPWTVGRTLFKKEICPKCYLELAKFMKGEEYEPNNGTTGRRPS